MYTRKHPDTSPTSGRHLADIPPTIRVTLFAKELAFIPDFSGMADRTLFRKRRAILDFCEKQSSQPLTIFDVARYFDVTPARVAAWLRRV